MKTAWVKLRGPLALVVDCDKPSATESSSVKWLETDPGSRWHDLNFDIDGWRVGDEVAKKRIYLFLIASPAGGVTKEGLVLQSHSKEGEFRRVGVARFHKEHLDWKEESITIV